MMGEWRILEKDGWMEMASRTVILPVDPSCSSDVTGSQAAKLDSMEKHKSGTKGRVGRH